VSSGSVISNLSPGTTYTGNLYAKNSTGDSGNASVSLTTLLAAPSVQDATSITTTSFIVNFTASTGATSYSITTNNGDETTITNKTLVTGLSPGTKYTYKLYAKDNTVKSTSSEFTVTTIIDPPTNLSTIDVTSSSFLIKFTGSSGATGYFVTIDDRSYDVADGSPVYNLAAGTTYTYKLYAKNQTVTSAGADISVTTIPNPPPNPTTPTINSTSFVLKFTPSVGATSYDITDSTGKLSKNVTASGATIDGLTPGTAYSCKILAKNASGSSSAKDFTVTTIIDPPTNPSGINVTSSSFNIKFTASSGATSYYININGNNYPVADGSPVTDLTAGTTCVCKLYAKNETVTSAAREFTVTSLPNPPPDPTTATIKSTSFVINFTPSTGAANYDIIDSTGRVLKNVAATGTTIDGLTPGTVYNCKILAKTAQGLSSTAKNFTVTTIIDPPTSVSSASITNTSFVLNFTGSTGATSYDITDSTTGNLLKNVTTSGETIPVTSGTVYTWKLYAKNQIVTSVATSFTFTSLPDPPTNIKVTDISNNSFVINFTGSPGASGHYITGNNTNVLSGAKITQTAGTKSSYSIYAVKNSVNSQVVLFDVLTIPDAPQNPKALNIKTNAFDLNFNGSTGSTGYDIIKSDGRTLNPVSQSGETVPIVGLNPGIENKLKMVAKNESGSSIATDFNIITIPDAPTNPVITNIKNNSFDLSFNTSTGAKSYEISTSNNGSLKTVTKTGETITGLTSGLENKLKIVSKNDTGTSTSTDFTVLTVPDAPTGIASKNIKNNSFNIEFNASIGATGYSVTINDSVAVDVSNNQTFTGLNSGTAYTCKLFAKNNTGSSTTSTLTVTTLPDPPGEVTAKKITSSSFDINFTNSTGATDYLLRVNDLSPVNVVTGQSIRGLTPGTKYNLKLSSKNASGSSSVNESSVTTIIDPPTFVQSETPTTSSFPVSFVGSQGATAYDIIVTDDSNSNITQSVTTLNNNVRGLLAGTTYNFVVIAKNAIVSSLPAVPITVKTTPSVPANIQKMDITEKSFTLKFTGSKGATSYILKDTSNIKINTTNTEIPVNDLSAAVAYNFTLAASNGHTSSTTVIDVLTVPKPPIVTLPTDITTSSFAVNFTESKGAKGHYYMDISNNKIEAKSGDTISKLTPGTIYNFPLYAYNESGSSTVSLVSVLTVPNPATTLTSSRITNVSFVLGFTSSFGTSSYDIMNSKGTVLKNVTNSGDTIPGLSPGVENKLKIVAKNASGSSSATEFTILTVPDAPTVPTSSNVKYNSFDIGLTTSLGATSYDIMNSSGAVLKNVTKTGETIPGLNLGVENKLKIFAKNASGSSTSTDFTVTTVPNNPDYNAPTNITTSSFTLKCSGSQGATSYTLSGDNSFNTIHTTQTENQVTNLLPGTTYTFSLIASNTIGSSTSTAYTVLTLPGPPIVTPATDIKTSSFVINFKSVKGAESYYFINKNSQITVNPGDTISKLTSGTTYNFPLYSKNKSGSSVAATVNVITLPDPPIVLANTDITTSSFVINFNSATGADSYYYIDENDKNNTNIPVKTGDTISKLTAGITYNFVLYSKNVTGSSAAAAVTFITLPDPPTEKSITNVTTSSFVLSFKSSIGAVAYKITGNGANSDIVSGSTISKLKSGSYYSYSLVAYNASGSSTAVPIKVITLPGPPIILAHTNITTSSFVINFNSAFGADSYYYIDKNDKNNTNIPIKTGDTISKLTAGTVYNFDVYSTNATGSSTESTPLTAMTLPDPPSEKSITNITTSSFLLTFKPSIGAVGYKITGNGANNEIVSGSTISGLKSGTSYSYSLIAYNSSGSSSAIPLDILTLPELPTLLSHSQITTTSLIFNFNPSIGATGYYIIINGKTMEISTGQPISSLLPGTTYSFDLYAKNATGSSAAQPVTVITLPEAPTEMAITNITISSFVLNFKEAVGATGYKITGVGMDKEIVSGSTISNLKSGTTYAYSLVAYNSSGSSSVIPIDILTLPDAPTVLAQTKITTSSFVFNFNSVNGADNYYYIDKNDENNTNILVKTGDTISKLTSGTTYNFVLYAKNATGSSMATEVTVITLPDPPSPLAHTDITTVSFILNFTSSIGADGYKISGNGIDSEIASGSVITNLTPGRAYTFSLIAYNKTGLSSVVQVTVTTLVDAPTAVEYTNITNGSFNLIFNSSIGATSYYITGPGLNSEVISGTTINKLTPATAYSFSLFAKNASGSSKSSDFTLTTLPDAPVVTQCTNITQKSFTLNFNFTKGAIGYRITGSGINIDKDVVPGSKISNLAAATKYTFTLYAINTTGLSQGTDFTITTLPNPPVAPTNISANAIGINSISITFTGSKGATSYILSGDNDVETINTTTQDIDVTNLLADTTYTFSLIAYNSGGQSPATKFTITTLPNPPSAPANIYAFSVGINNLFLKFTSSETATSYTISGNNGFASINTTEDLINVANLLAETTYTFSVTANNAGGMSSPAKVTVTTLPNPPLAPTNISISKIGINQFYLNFSGSKGATSYLLSGDNDFAPVTSILPNKNIEITALTAKTIYIFSLTAINSGGSSPATTFKMKTLPNPPNSPIVDVRSITNSSFVLSFTAPIDAVSYSLSASNYNSGNENLDIKEGATSITGLSPGTTYNFSLIAIDEGGNSQPALFAVTTIPSEPTFNSTYNLTNSSFILLFTGSKGATSYTISSPNYKSGLANTMITPTSNNTTPGTNNTITGLTPSTKYDFSITANNSNGSSPPISFSVTTLPDAPTLISTNDITLNSFAFSFTTTGNVGIYSLYAPNYKSGVANTSVTPMSNNATTASPGNYTTTSPPGKNNVITGLASGTVYNFTLTCITSSGVSPPTEFSITTLPLPPSAYVKSSITSNSFLLTFTDSPTAISYNIVGDNGFITLNTKQTSEISITGLLPSTKYYFGVVANNVSGVSRMTRFNVTTTAIPVTTTAAPVTTTAAPVTTTAAPVTTTYPPLSTYSQLTTYAPVTSSALVTTTYAPTDSVTYNTTLSPSTDVVQDIVKDISTTPPATYIAETTPSLNSYIYSTTTATPYSGSSVFNTSTRVAAKPIITYTSIQHYAGDIVLEIKETSQFELGMDIIISGSGNYPAENNKVVKLDGNIVLEYPLEYDHPAGTQIYGIANKTSSSSNVIISNDEKDYTLQRGVPSRSQKQPPSATQNVTSHSTGNYVDVNYGSRSLSSSDINDRTQIDHDIRSGNIYNNGDIYVIPKTNSGQHLQYRPDDINTSGKLGGVISETKSEIVFPDCPENNMYSYNGILRCKGDDFLPLNTMNQKMKTDDRLNYQPPSLPAHLDFSYFGILRDKGSDFKPLNASAAENNQRILNSSYGKNYFTESPQVNTTRSPLYKTDPINTQSKYK
jgi:hypothetical protein